MTSSASPLTPSSAKDGNRVKSTEITKSALIQSLQKQKRSVVWKRGLNGEDVVGLGPGEVVFYGFYQSRLFPRAQLNKQDGLTNVKCFDWQQNVLALGLSQGKVIVTLLSPDSSSAPGLIIKGKSEKSEGLKTLLPRHIRPCTSVACHPSMHLLAGGFEKTRIDANIYIWDLKSDDSRALLSLGPGGDTVQSFAWLVNDFHPSSTLLAAGMGGKWIKIWDIANPNSNLSPNMVLGPTKSTQLVASPSSNVLLSYTHGDPSDTTLKLWDLKKDRNGEPVLTLDAQGPIFNVSWGKGGSVAVCSTLSRLFTLAMGDDVPILLNSRIIVAPEELAITYVLLDSQSRQMLLFLSNSTPRLDQGNYLAQTMESLVIVDIPDPVPSSLAPDGTTVMVRDQVVEVMDTIFDDVSSLMKKRAEQGYALNCSRNRRLFLQDSIQLYRIWTWLERVIRLKDQGVDGVLEMISGKMDKSIILHLLGFHHQDLEEVVTSLQSQKRFEEAAVLLAVETQKWDSVLDCLLQGDEQTKLIATTLSSLTFPLQQAKAVSLPSQDLEIVLDLMSNVTSSRLPISLRFAYNLSTDKPLEQDVDSSVTQGDLDVLPLIGWKDGKWKTVLKRYLEKTGDVQSVALISIYLTNLSGGEQDETVQLYRNLLDRWSLFNQRCHLDVEMVQLSKELNQTPPQIHPPVMLRCAYCNANLIGSFGHCQQCKKPLPRCALCGISITQPIKKVVDWFVWCNSCKHGGHAKHLQAWFQEARSCPVSGCTCRCNEL